MELVSKNYFGLTGFLLHMSHCLSKEEEASPRELTLLEKVKKEAPWRIAASVGAYYALPIFAWLGGMLQLSLCAYKGWTKILVPLARKDPNPLNEAFQESFEHLIRATYNFTIYFFRRSSSFTFLFPYETILSAHKKMEGDLISFQDQSQSEEVVEDPNTGIKKCARFLTGLTLGNLSPEDNLTQQASQTLRRSLAPYWEDTQGLIAHVRQAAARRLSGAGPG